MQRAEISMKKTILVLGGAGYIGSNTAYLLNQRGYEIIIIDKLIYKQKFDHDFAKLIVGDFADTNLLESVFEKYKIDAVMHFAAFIEVGVSVTNPAEFYDNNVVKTIKFLDTMIKHGVKNFIFSSSCAVYGNPVKVPIDEAHPYAPISPYGKNKLIVEYVLQDYAQAYDLKYISLRYFNAAGADPKNNLGEQHIPETHIIPLLLRAIKNKKTFKIFGDDYNTPDGTCIRDYIHVKDLALAHLLAFEYLIKEKKSQVFNLGTGHGYSVKELITAAEKEAGQEANIEVFARRAGDVDTLIADNKKIKSILNWEPSYSNLENIIHSALEWENR